MTTKIKYNPCKPCCTTPGCSYGVVANDPNKPCRAYFSLWGNAYLQYTLNITRTDGLVTFPPLGAPGTFQVTIHGNPHGVVAYTAPPGLSDFYPNLDATFHYYPDTSYNFSVDCKKQGETFIFDGPYISDYSIVIEFNVTRKYFLSGFPFFQGASGGILDNGKSINKVIASITDYEPGVWAVVKSNGDGHNMIESRTATFHFVEILDGNIPVHGVLYPAADILFNFTLNFCNGPFQIISLTTNA